MGRGLSRCCFTSVAQSRAGLSLARNSRASRSLGRVCESAFAVAPNHFVEDHRVPVFVPVLNGCVVPTRPSSHSHFFDRVHFIHACLLQHGIRLHDFLLLRLTRTNRHLKEPNPPGRQVNSPDANSEDLFRKKKAARQPDFSKILRRDPKIVLDLGVWRNSAG